MSSPLSRRSLLLGTSALAFLAACGGDKKKDDVAVDDTDTADGQQDVLSYQSAGTMYASGYEERVSFGLFQGVPATLVGEGAKVMVAFQKPGTKVLTDPVLAERKSEGLPDRANYFVVHHTFDVPGRWGVRATIAGKKPADAIIEISDASTAPWPAPGKPLPNVKTPTKADAMEVDPICTRSEGICPFHEKSLHELLGNGKPTMVLLATPALCQSQMCGPVLDTLMGAQDVIGDKINVVHVEVFKDTTGKVLSPSFAEFKLESEPVLFFADRDGVIRERFIGPFDETEARAGINRLLA